MTNVNLLFKHLRVLKFRSYPLGAKIGACNSSFARASVAKRQCKTQVLFMRMIMRGMRGIKRYENIRKCDDDITCRSVHGDEAALTIRLEIRSA